MRSASYETAALPLSYIGTGGVCGVALCRLENLSPTTRA
jgi:hypothetical protein